jgi:hypothetical protein
MEIRGPVSTAYMHFSPESVSREIEFDERSSEEKVEENL